MKRLSLSLAAACAALVLTAGLALAADPEKKPESAPAAHSAHKMGGMTARHQGMGLAALPPEKQDIARALMDEHKAALFPLHQSLYAKTAELEALNAAGNGETDKAKAVIRELGDLHARMLTEDARFRAKLVKETGLRTPPMGHGGMAGMMGGKGMMGGGMMKGMAGGTGCPMMEKMGGMDHGAAPAATAKSAPQKAAKAPAKPAAHDAHGS